MSAFSSDVARSLLNLRSSTTASSGSQTATNPSNEDISFEDNSINLSVIHQRFEDEDNLDDVEEEDVEENVQIQNIFRANLVENTRTNYHRSTSRFAVWIFNQWSVTGLPKYRSLLHDTLFAALQESNTKQSAKVAISRADADFHPIQLQHLTVNDFIAFLLSLTPSGEYLSKSAYGTHRAALFDLFRQCKMKQTDVFTSDLQVAFAGLKRICQRYKVNHINSPT